MTYELKIITGPMFAGKTTALINEIINVDSLISDFNKLKFNYAGDKRYNEEANISSHTQEIVKSIPITNCFEINKYITDNIKVIYVDEVQFLHSVEEWFKTSKDCFVSAKKHLHLMKTEVRVNQMIDCSANSKPNFHMVSLLSKSSAFCDK